MSRGKPLGAAATFLAALLIVAGPAWAFLSITTSAVSPMVTANTMTGPTSVTVTSINGVATLSWAAPTTPAGAGFTYTVSRGGGSGVMTGGCAATSLSTTSCQDTAATPGQTYTWTVTAHLGLWNSPTGQVTGTAAGSVSQFVVANPGNQVAGTSFSVTVTAEDSLNDTVTGYSGTQPLTWSGPASSPSPSNTAPSYPSSVSFGPGTGKATATITLYDAASAVTLTATQGAVSGTSTGFNVAAATLHSLALSAVSSSVTAGGTDNLTITALDSYDNTVTTYSGSKTLNFTGANSSPSGSNPSVTDNAGTAKAFSTTVNTAITFVAGVASNATSGTTNQLVMTLYKAETASVVVSDGTVTSSASPLSVAVTAASATRLAWTGVTVPAGTLSSPCLFTCTDTGLGNNQTFKASVSVTDPYGNIENNLGSGHTVTIATTQNQSGGQFTAPTSNASSETLTISGTGAATSTATFTYKSGNGTNGHTATWTDLLSATSASGTTYTSASGSVTKN